MNITFGSTNEPPHAPPTHTDGRLGPANGAMVQSSGCQPTEGGRNTGPANGEWAGDRSLLGSRDTATSGMGASTTDDEEWTADDSELRMSEERSTTGNERVVWDDDVVNAICAELNASTERRLLEEAGRATSAEVLLRIAERARFFPGNDDRFYARFAVDDHEETHELRSSSFRRWLIREFRKETRGFVPVEALNGLIASLEADAEDAGPKETVHLRIGGDLEGTVIYVDLGDRSRRAVAITAAGWEIVAQPDVAFRRPKGMAPLAEPKAGGSLDVLKKYVNLDDDEFLLLIGWLTAALRPTGPYPILVLTAEQGSAKTTLARIVRKLVDPHLSPLAGEPREPRDLMVAAQNGWALALDNISTVPPWLSDSLCRLATGGGLHVRTLYSNDELTFLDAMRPIILNGIDDFVRRGDLSDRSVYLRPPTIPEEDRQLQSKLMAEFDRDYPFILGALIDAVAGGMRMEPLLDLPRLPRMADFAHFAEAVCQGLGHPAGAFLAAYDRNRQAANESVLDDSPVARAIRTFIADANSWTGTASELLDELTAVAGERDLTLKAWPRRPKVLSSIMRRIAPQLRTTGLIVDFDRNTNSRTITLGRKDRAADDPSLSSRASPQAEDSAPYDAHDAHDAESRTNRGDADDTELA
jgi:hypothetical protein